jgi:wyosine [tRNA(Phe)-imidazoG37] synthetase (radical SAM superfamily)
VTKGAIMAYIVDEEMPKSCTNECMFCSVDIPRNSDIFVRCFLLEYKNSFIKKDEVEEKRRDDCPLKEID